VTAAAGFLIDLGLDSKLGHFGALGFRDPVVF